MALDERDYMRDPTRRRLGGKRRTGPLTDEVALGSAYWIGKPMNAGEQWQAAYDKAMRPKTRWRRLMLARERRIGFRRPMSGATWVALAVGGMMGAWPIGTSMAASQDLNQRQIVNGFNAEDGKVSQEVRDGPR